MTFQLDVYLMRSDRKQAHTLEHPAKRERFLSVFRDVNEWTANVPQIISWTTNSKLCTSQGNWGLQHPRTPKPLPTESGKSIRPIFSAEASSQTRKEVSFLLIKQKWNLFRPARWSVWNLGYFTNNYWLRSWVESGKAILNEIYYLRCESLRLLITGYHRIIQCRGL